MTHDLKIQSENTERLLTSVYNETEKPAVRDLASAAVIAIQKQLKSVEAFSEMMDEEAAINLEQVKVRKVNLEVVLNEVRSSFKSKLEAKSIVLKFNIHT
ncbi:hypothetical protein FLAN108750_11325 [Flavobacterium antarcticum]|uniref:hypothetical protein n=1 Tax=Flavobacterium antarcticum TaxID=271155 RepID=UPI0003B3EDDC|nr:hypothetical protein [Flavobacterium antarcticum]